MTAEQLLGADQPQRPEPADADTAEMVTAIRSSFALIEPHADKVVKLFYALLFDIAPETRDLFPANMEIQRSRLLRALVYVVEMVDRPDELAAFLSQLGRDHRKFGVLTEHYDAVGTALLGALEHIAGPAWSPTVAKAWTDAYAQVAAAMTAAADSETGPACWSAEVLDHRRLANDLAIITVQPESPVPYRAGQYVSVETPQRPRLWRYLSPANAPRPDGRLEFHVRAVESGWVSASIVGNTNPGDTWQIGPPMGQLAVNRESGDDVLMIAGGTGIAPIKALLEHLTTWGENPRTQVFVGGRSWEGLYAIDSIRKLSHTNPWLNVIPVVERDSPGSGAERGVLADVVTRYGAWPGHDVIVAGSPSMIRATVSRMLVAGTPLDRIRYDPFTVD
jgi:NAD(P)H-flavin reductase/hemoglobin-like flavoprotein